MRVVIRLNAAEKTLAMRRKDVVLERDMISSAVITDDPWVWLRGVRSPGAHVPGRIAIGTWRALGGRDFAVIRSGRPAVVIDLQEAGDAEDGAADRGGYDAFARVIVSTRHAAELIAALRIEEPEAGGAAVFSAVD
nr:hypothetical protein [Leucobacter weissii]